MRRLALLFPALLLAACADRAPEPAQEEGQQPEAAAQPAGAKGVFFTLQGENAVGSLAGAKFAAGNTPTYLDISPDGRTLVVAASGEDRIYVLDAVTGALRDTIPVGKSPKGVRFAQWPELVYVANEGSGSISVVSLQERSVQEVPLGKVPHNMVIDEAAQLLFVTLQGDDAIAVIDQEMMRVLETIPVPGHPHNLARSPETGMLFISLLETQELIKFNYSTRVVEGRAKLSGPHYGVELSPDGKWVYATGMAGSVLNVIDANTMQNVAQVEVGLGPHGVRTNGMGDEIYVAVSGTNEIVVVDATTRAVKQRHAVGAKPFWIAVRE